MNNIGKWQYGWLVKGFYSSVFSRIVLFLALGIFVADRLSESEFWSGQLVGLVGVQTFCWCLLLVLSAVVILISTLCKWSKEWIFIVFSNLFFLSGGGFLLSCYRLPVAASGMSDCTYILKLATEPVLNNSCFRADAVVVGCIGRTDSCLSSISENLAGAKIVVNIENDSCLAHVPHLTDHFLFKGKIYLPRHEGNPYAFDYGDYLLKHGYSGVAYCHSPYFQYIQPPYGSKSDFFQWVESVRARLIGRYRKIGLSGDNLAVVAAITLGERSLLSSERKAGFSAAGVQHVLVVSGLHVGFLFMIVILVLRHLQRKVCRYMAVCAGILVLWLYALLTGLAPAVVRAAVMFSIMLVFYTGGEYYRTYHALMIAAVITLISNPYLLFDTGFLLSYSAVLSISFFYPEFYRQYSRLGIRSVVADRIMQAVMVTVSAQILTFPIAVYSFCQFPVYFIVSNIVAAFITPLLFCGGMSALLVGDVPYLGMLMGKILAFIVCLFDNVVISISHLPMSIVSGWLTKADVAVLYLVIASVVNLFMMWRYHNKRFYALVIVLGSLFLGFTVNSVTYIRRTESDGLYILGQKRLCLDVVSHGRNVVFSSVSDTAFLKRQLLPLQLRYDAPSPQFVTTNALADNYFMYNGKTYLVLRDNPFRYKINKGNRLDVDCLIIGRGIYPSQKLFDSFVRPKSVYLAAGIWSGYVLRFGQLLDERGIALCERLPCE